MKAAVVHGIDDIRYEETKDAEIENSHQVKIKVGACGICQSDVPRVLNGTAHFFPMILGHEFSGIVTEIGSDVDNVKVGDRVAGIPLVPCFECDTCKDGNYALCKHYSFIGSRQFGAFAEYAVVPDTNVIKIDENVSFEQGALIETSTIALHGFKLVNYNAKKAKNVAILGFGTVGAFAVQWARILGAENIVVFGRNSERLEFAKELGATHVVNTTEKEYEKKALEITEGNGYNYVFETAGSPETIKACFKLAGNKADVCMIGTPQKEVTFAWKEWELMNRKEFRLTGSWMSYSAPFPGEEWTRTIECLATGELRYDERLLYKKFDLSEIRSAFDCYKNEKVSGRIMLTNPM